ncbi:neprilysin-like [Dermacentor albipictus]|uniref:neprilysin-like n=1 Tax=Dermacentor albipictus TaxID=60249 RepID=UPI0031FBF376
MATPVKADSSQCRASDEEKAQAGGFIESGYQPPQHGMRQVIDRPFQPQQTGPRRDSDHLQKLGAPTARDDHSQLGPPRVLRASKNSQHPIGVARRGSNESNQRGDQKMPAHGQHPQPQRSRSMPTLPDSTRASFVDTHSHMRYGSAGSTGTPGSSAGMHRSSPWLAPAGSVLERGRPTPLAPAVAAAAAALQTPLSARRTSQGSSFMSGMMRPKQRPLTPFCYAAIAAVCLVVCLAVLLAFLSSLLDDVETGQLATCTTHACREYAQRLLASLNSSVKPCHSFTRFVCDGWRRRQLLGVQEEAFGAANKRIERIVRTIDVPSSGQKPLERAAMLYRSCIAVLTTPTGEFAEVKAALRAAGVTWPHRPPPIERRDLLRMMFHCDYALGWSAVFRVDPEVRQNSTKAYVLTDSGFNFIVRKYHERNSEANRQHYFTRLRNAFRDTDTEAASDVITFEETQRLEENMFGPLIAAFHKNAPNVLVVPADVVYNASANLSLDRWTEVLESEGVELVGLLEFRTWNLPFFSTFVDLLAHHGELDMYALVSWCTVQVAALFANGELVVNFYGHPQRALVLHGAFCLSRAYIAAGRTLMYKYAREVLPVVARRHAESIVLAVRTAFRKRLFTWPDYNASVSVIWSWENVSLTFSIFAPATKANFTDIVVGEMGDSFLQNWHNAWMSRTFSRGIDIKIAISAIETLSFSADIEYRKEFILLPYVFFFPYYDINSVPSLNYGGFGAQVASAVGQRFHNTYLGAGAGGNSFRTFLSCISNRSLAAEHTDTASLLAEVVSLGALIDAYRNVSDNRRLVLLEHMTGEQLLFIAICYAKCIGSYYIVNDSLCNAVLQNVPEFSEAFGCAPGTPMNPHQQCKLL